MATISSKQFLGGQSAKIISTPAEEIQQIKEPGFLSRVSTDIGKRVEGYKQETKGGTNPIIGAFKGTAQGFGILGDVAGEAIKSIPVVNKVAEGIGGLAQKGFSKLINYASPIGEELLKLEQTHPNEAKIITNFLEVASSAGDIAGNILLAEGLKTSGLKSGQLIKKSAGKLPLKETGSLLKTAGEKTTGIGVAMEEPTRIALQTYQANQPTIFERVKNFITGTEKTVGEVPTTEANTAVRLLKPGTEWQLGVEAKKISSDLWNNTIKPVLKEDILGVPGKKNSVNMKDWLNGLKTDIIKNTPELGRRKTLLEAFDSFAEDYKKVSRVGMEKLQEYKEGWAKTVPEATYKGKPIASSLKEIKNMAASKARTTIYDALDYVKNDFGIDIKQAYIDYGNLKSIAKAGIKSVDPLRSKGVTKQVWEMIMDKAVTPVATVSGKILYKTGEGLEFLGEKGAKKVKDIIK